MGTKTIPDPTSRWLYVALGLLGTCVGFFTGLSESPITATVIPLLFGLISGGAGISLVRLDSSTPEGFQKQRSLSLSLVAFTVACLLASVYGISLRTGSGVSVFWKGVAQNGPVALPDVGSGASFDQQAQLLLLRRRLEASTQARTAGCEPHGDRTSADSVRRNPTKKTLRSASSRTPRASHKAL
jgi:hypothetical protein